MPDKRLPTIFARYRGWLQSRPDATRLPLRVRVAIQRQQESSEVLIGWIQLGVVVSFAILYTLSPKTFTEDAEFAPVPWVLAAYFVFTVLRLILAH